MLDTPPLPPKAIGAALIEFYDDFGLFLRELGVRDEGFRVRTRDVASLAYLLLRTMGPSSRCRAPFSRKSMTNSLRPAGMRHSERSATPIWLAEHRLCRRSK